MKNEYELIEHPYIKHLNVFLVNLDYRTPHLHEDIELILILEGSVTTHTQGERYDLDTNSTVIFNSNQPHEFNSAKEGALILCLQVNPKLFLPCYPAFGDLHFDSYRVDQHLPAERQNFVKAVLIETAYQYYAKEPGYELYCLSLLSQLFRVFLQIIPHHFVSEDERKVSLNRTERLVRIINYIDENYMNKIFLSDIARREKLSMAYLSHFFKDNLNQTFQEYVSNLRFSHARVLVEENRMKLIDICFECGFSDYRYFCKAFLKNYGCTPTEYQSFHKPIMRTKGYSSSKSSETFYSIKDTINILEKFHVQNAQLFNTLPNPIFSSLSPL